MAIGFNVETVTYKNLKFQVWDLGGQTSIRPYWRCYYSNTDAIIYVVDSCDRDRMGISKSELVAMLEEEELKKAILVVFANKQDMEQAMTPTEVANSLGLSALKDRKWQIFKTSATKGTGLDEAMEWYAAQSLVFYIFLKSIKAGTAKIKNAYFACLQAQTYDCFKSWSTNKTSEP
ncbi:UNVERIFIED_CONTAM: hypothetical protein FKN15_015768 [Acipenser sinensis]